ncbi:hypothetical protein IMZ31_24155 (plasmid) [Pontibacillus sp. ALD_SL1]|uniref:hypothetical protein n=1 Tax=Pontibacillus sp. ALD_SL1 TaxID=2777185 RepID=UPI001A96D17C|nr:hypothetical protein [Pontibacillus sp. ALD_SL1]QST02546.1 hypothetical protein IMZ31_24155 [Pontibacillus sp. ALD_SL1]
MFTCKNKKGQRYTFVGEFLVIREAKRHCSVYRNGILIKTGMGWNRAVKLARLLNDAYLAGVEDGKRFEPIQEMGNENG